MKDYGIALQWILRSKEPSIRYIALTELLNEPEDSIDVRKSREAIPEGRKVRALLSDQTQSGGFDVDPYRKWIGSHWRLVSLVNLAISPEMDGHSKQRKKSLDGNTGGEPIGTTGTLREV